MTVEEFSTEFPMSVDHIKHVNMEYSVATLLKNCTTRNLTLKYKDKLSYMVAHEELIGS